MLESKKKNGISQSGFRTHDLQISGWSFILFSATPLDTTILKETHYYIHLICFIKMSNAFF